MPKHFFAAGLKKNANLYKFLNEKFKGNVPLKKTTNSNSEADALIGFVKENKLSDLKILSEKKSVDFNAKNGLPLYEAAGRGHADCVAYLVEQGAEIMPKHFFAAGFKKNKNLYKFLNKNYMTSDSEALLKKREHSEKENLSKDFTGPITREIMIDPVVAMDGHS